MLYVAISFWEYPSPIVEALGLKILIPRHANMQWSTTLCYAFEFLLETVPQMFHNASIWLTLSLAIQRYIYICKAARARHLCTIPRARFVVGCIMMAAAIHISPRLVDRVYTVRMEGKIQCSSEKRYNYIRTENQCSFD